MELGRGDRRPWRRFYNERAAALVRPEPFPLSHLLEGAASTHGNRPAFSYAGTTASYADVRSLVAQLATGYAEIGIGKGDRVGYMGPAHPSFTFSCFALWHVGAIGVGLNPLFSKRRLIEQAHYAGLTAIVTIDDPDVLAKALEVTESLGRKMTIVVAKATSLDPRAAARVPVQNGVQTRLIKMAELIAAGQPVDRTSINPLTDPAVLQYTGGTTGISKSAILTHANLSVNVAQMTCWFPQLIRGEEAVLSVAPVTHIAGVGPIQNFTVGLAGKLAVQTRFDPAKVLDFLEEQEITIVLAVPPIIVAMLEACSARKFDWSRIRSVQTGAAPVPGELKRRFREATGLEITTLYGMTETSPAAIYSSPRPEHAEATGIPLPFTDVEIRSPSDPNQTMPFGTAGEIYIRGPQVMKGYWRHDDENRQAFVDGFFRSGDIGTMTEEGVITVIDRLKDVIIASGYNIYPGDVENAILEHPRVREAVVIGVPDSYRGETVKAIISLRNGEVDLEELQAFLASRLSPMEIPKQLEVVADIPKNENLKVSRQVLKERERDHRWRISTAKEHDPGPAPAAFIPS